MTFTESLWNLGTTNTPRRSLIFILTSLQEFPLYKLQVRMEPSPLELETVTLLSLSESLRTT